MYGLLVGQEPRELLLKQAPTLATSLLIAEFFYKFGSFALEAVAFLVTWCLLDWLRERTLHSKEEVN